MKVHCNSIDGIVLLCLVCTLLVPGCKTSGDYSGPPNGFKRYPYERVHATYEYSGDVRGTEEFFFSEFGKYEARYSKVEILSDKGIQPSDNGAITRLSDQYTCDFTKKTAIHERLQVLDSLYHLEGNQMPSAYQYLESEMKRNSFHSAGTDFIEGKPAEKWVQDNGTLTIWIWNSILLHKRVSSETGTMDMVVKSIDTLWSVDTARFSIPAGFKTTEGKDMNNAPPAN